MKVELEYRYGGEGTKKFINILLLFKKYSENKVKKAVKRCVSLGAWDDTHVMVILNHQHIPVPKILDLKNRPELQVEAGVRPAQIYDIATKEVIG